MKRNVWEESRCIYAHGQESNAPPQCDTPSVAPVHEKLAPETYESLQTSLSADTWAQTPHGIYNPISNGTGFDTIGSLLFSPTELAH